MSRPASSPQAAPRSAPPVAAAAVVLGFVVLLLGAALITDAAGAVVSGDGPAGAAAKLLDGLDGLAASPGTTAGGVIAALIGLYLVFSVLRPAPRTHVGLKPAGPATDLWLTPRAVATLAAEQAEQHADVLDARVESANRRRVVVEVIPRDVDAGSGLADAVRREVEAGLSNAGITGIRVQVRVEVE